MGYSTQDYLQCIIPYLGKTSTEKYHDDYIRGVAPTEVELSELLPLFGIEFKLVSPKDLWSSKLGIKKNTEGKILQIDPLSPAFYQLSIGDIIQNIEQITFETDKVILSIDRYGKEINTVLSINDTSYFQHYQSQVINSNQLQQEWLQ